MVLDQNFREFIELLNEKNVKYLVVGGYAVAYHGYPRYTKDIDIWIWLNKENAMRVVEAIKDFGFESLGLVVEDFLDKENVIQLGYPPARIDLLTDLLELTFEECYKKRSLVNSDGLKIDFIGLDSLIRTKLATGRPQDIVDSQKLAKKKNKL